MAEELSLLDGLFQLSFLLQSRLSHIAAAHELSLIQVRLLGILRDREPTMLELARHLDLEKSSLSGLIDRAQARGLVERVASKDDRRATTVRTTAAGKKLTRAFSEKIEREVEKLVAVLPEKERGKLRALLTQIVQQSA